MYYVIEFTRIEIECGLRIWRIYNPHEYYKTVEFQLQTPTGSCRTRKLCYSQIAKICNQKTFLYCAQTFRFSILLAKNDPLTISFFFETESVCHLLQIMSLLILFPKNCFVSQPLRSKMDQGLPIQLSLTDLFLKNLGIRSIVDTHEKFNKSVPVLSAPVLSAPGSLLASSSPDIVRSYK